MKRVTVISVAAIVLASCEGTQSPTVPDAYLTLGSPAQRATAHTHSPNPHFFFLPPLAPNTTFPGVFDGSLDPVVEICAWTGAECDGPPVAELTTGSQGLERIRVMRTHYSVNWHTNHSNLVANQVYRILASVEGTVLGYADVRMVMRMIGKKNKVRPDDRIRIRMGSTIPIRFRIEEGALPATGNLDVTASATGPDLDTDYTVTVDGSTSQALSAGGTVTFSALTAGDHTVQLTGVASNCTVSGTNPRTVTVPAGGTAQTTFDVSCTSVPPVITGVSWACSALITDAVGSDLWPITWSDDDNQYTAWGDGFGFDGQPTKSGRGISRLQGDPTTYTASDLFHSDDGGGAPFIEGIGSVGGVLYMIYNQGPTRELWKSTDKGLSETGPLASWPATGHQPRYFVQMGQDNNGLGDGYVYIRMTGPTGDATEFYLARVLEADIETKSAWEFFTGTSTNPSWSTSSAGATEIFSGSDAHISITYFPPLAKFIGVSGWDGGDLGNLNIYQAPNVYGPYTSIQSYTNWCGWGSEPTPRARHVSPKWLSADGSEFWMAFSGGGMWDRFNLIKGTFQLQ